MGLFDFVKGGVQRMMIARADAAKDQVVFKHPDQTFPFWSQLTVDSDEVCLFFKDGQYVGSLGPGRHTLQTENIPFLNALVDRLTGQNVFISELYFVTTRPLYNQGFGDTIGSMRDPELELRVTPRAFGTYSFRVVDPVRFVVEFVGQTGAADPDSVLRWVRDQLFQGLRTTLTRMIRAGEITFMDLGTAGTDVARSVVRDCPDLAKVGVQVLEVAKLNLNLNEEDQKRVDAVQGQIVEAKAKARVAKIGISQKEAEVAQRQMELDQNFANQARYLQQLDMGRYQQYAAAQAVMGLGEGMAKGGEGASAGNLAAGMGMGAGMMYGAFGTPGPAGHPPPGYGAPQAGAAPPGYGPGYGSQPGYPGAVPYQNPQPPQGAPPVSPPQVAPPQVAPQQVAPQQVAPQQAAPPQADALRCAKCAWPNPLGSKFCSECGTRLN
jgi:membrane protease subunit (stomatin/prohibitin family)